MLRGLGLGRRLVNLLLLAQRTKTLTNWARGKRLTNRLPNLSLITEPGGVGARSAACCGCGRSVSKQNVDSDIHIGTDNDSPNTHRQHGIHRQTPNTLPALPTATTLFQHPSRRPRWLGRWSACLSRSISWVQAPPSVCS